MILENRFTHISLYDVLEIFVPRAARVQKVTLIVFICDCEWYYWRKYTWNSRKTLDSNDHNQVADQQFSLKQWFAGGAQSSVSRAQKTWLLSVR